MKYRPMILVLLAVALGAHAQESLNEIRRSIKSVEQETAREKDLTEAEAKRHAAFVETNRQKIASLEQQQNTLRGQLDSLRAEIARLHDAKQKTAGGARYFEGRKARYAQDLAKLIDSLAPKVQNDFPYKNDEAVDAIRDAAAQLRKGVIAPDEALGRVLELLLDRIRLGYTTETWSGYLAVDGRSIPGKFLRYGAVASLFIGQNGDDIYWLSTTEKGYAWVSVGSNLNLRAQFKETMKVAEGKASPNLVSIPIPTMQALQGGAQ